MNIVFLLALTGIITAKYQNYNTQKCGKKTVTNVLRNGSATKALNAMPWAVLLNIRHGVEEDQLEVCGATLITSKHLITAAHCFRRARPSKPTRECSSEDGMSVEEIANKTTAIVGGSCVAAVEELNCYPEMVGKPMKIVRAEVGDFFKTKCINGSDYALLELDEPVDVKGPANHVCLTQLDAIQRGDDIKILKAFGWGSDPLQEYETAPTPFLQMVELDVVPREDCKSEWGEEFSPDALCTEEQSKKDVCSGDSGGGLTFAQNGRQYMAGVISYGSDCNGLVQGQRPRAQINTDVEKYIDKIIEFITD